MSTSGDPLNREIRQEDVQNVVRDLGIRDATKQVEVERAIESLCRELWNLEKLISGADRKQQLQFITDVDRLLRQLRKRLNGADANTNATLGRLLGLPLARILGGWGLQELTPDIAPREPRLSEDSWSRGRHQVRAVPDSWVVQEITADNAVLILASLISELQWPLTAALENEKTHKGGRRPKPFRARLIRRAAHIYSDATGLEPTPAQGGPFYKFCGDILDLVDLPQLGLRYAIRRYFETK